MLWGQHQCCLARALEPPDFLQGSSSQATAHSAASLGLDPSLAGCKLTLAASKASTAPVLSLTETYLAFLLLLAPTSTSAVGLGPLQPTVHPAPGLQDLLSPRQLAPPGGQKSTAAPSVL